MRIYMDTDGLRGWIEYGHFEGNVPFSKEEEEEFQSLLKKEEDDEELTKEEEETLEKYKNKILEYSSIIVDEYEITDFGNITWRDLLY